MTVCLAVLCDGGKSIIAASDRMITTAYPPVEFEHNVGKIELLSNNCVALTAGSALAHTELFAQTRADIVDLTIPSPQLIAGKVKENFVKQRLARAEDEYLHPRGMTVASFYGKHISGLPSQVGLTIDQRIQSIKYNLEIILAGCDSTGTGHIFGIRDPGICDCFDALGYHAIGSGEMHVLSAFISNGLTLDWDSARAATLALQAKKNAEVAPGVGKATDMALVTKAGIEILDEECLSVIENAIPTAQITFSDEAIGEVSRMLHELPGGD